MDNLQYKDATSGRIELKSEEGNEALHIKAYVLAFNNVDSYGDIIAPTACDDFLKSESSARMALCYQHDLNNVIGTITDKGVDDYGLYIEADILPTQSGKDVAVLIRGGAIKEFSIGYIAQESHDEVKNGQNVRVLDKISIWEASPVTRAANPKAVITEAKAEEPQGEEVKAENEAISNSIDTMENEEIKSMHESIEGAVNQIDGVKGEMLAAKEELNAVKADIDALDNSIKELNKKFNEKSNSKKMENLKTALHDVMEQKRDAINAMVEKKDGRVRMEFKVSTPSDNAAVGAQVIPGVASAPTLPFAFQASMSKGSYAGNTIAWLEGTVTTDNTGYVDELAAATDSVLTVAEKTRKYAKIASSIKISSEVANLFGEVYNWAVTEGALKIQKKAEAEIYNGNGGSANPKHVYGLVGQSTAFSGLAKYSNATIADVILDAVAQVAKEGYMADTCVLSYAGLAALRGVKDTTGNYVYNQVTGMLGQVKVIPSAYVGANVLFVYDSACTKIFDNGEYELEIERLASVDGWGAYLRKHVQLIVETAKQKGVIYVANTATAITAITPSA